MPRSLRLFVFARHGESVLNLERRINGDPTKAVDLTERGRFEATRLGEQLAGLHLDVCLHTRFLRAARTAYIALAGIVLSF
jgi:broad specificity phosphatase PhoE